MPQTVSLAGKTALITGAAGGLGLQIALAFQAAGSKVVVCDINKVMLEQTLEANKDLTGKVADVSDEGSVKDLFTFAGKIDIVVNNAGVMDRFDPVGECELVTWERVLKVNLTGPYVVSKAAIQQMEKGVILNVASLGGLFGFRAGAAYTASKHGVIGLTKNTAAFYGKRGIRCNAICPGGMETNIGAAMANGVNQEGYALVMSTMAIQPEMCSTKQIAKLCVYLCSEDAEVVNGAIINTDRGWGSY